MRKVEVEVVRVPRKRVIEIEPPKLKEIVVEEKIEDVIVDEPDVIEETVEEEVEEVEEVVEKEPEKLEPYIPIEGKFERKLNYNLYIYSFKNYRSIYPPFDSTNTRC